jgi:hypothetical protein
MLQILKAQQEETRSYQWDSTSTHIRLEKRQRRMPAARVIRHKVYPNDVVPDRSIVSKDAKISSHDGSFAFGQSGTLNTTG